jgi:hypothetical protein
VTSGEVLLNGQVAQRDHLRSLSAYVLQDDVMLVCVALLCIRESPFPQSTMTPRETVEFSANFRLPLTVASLYALRVCVCLI